jgi:hypothetical protein
LYKPLIKTVNYITTGHVTQEAELGRVLKKRAFQTGIIQAVGKGNAVEKQWFLDE